MKKASTIIILDKNDHILLQHRDAGAPTHPNMWGLWGGELEAGESFAEAAIREIGEELGIRVQASDLSQFGRYLEEEGTKEVLVFVLRDTGAFTYVLGEGDGMQFFNREELKDLPLVPTTRQATTDYYTTA